MRIGTAMGEIIEVTMTTEDRIMKRIVEGMGMGRITGIKIETKDLIIHRDTIREVDMIIEMYVIKDLLLKWIWFCLKGIIMNSSVFLLSN